MTGGQTALSLDDEAGDVAAVDEAAGPRTRREGLTLQIVRASPEEAEAHEALINRMRDNGACRWRDS